jgi:hypothetical protein
MVKDRLHNYRGGCLILHFKLSNALRGQYLVDFTSSPTRGVRHGCSDAHGVDWMASHLLLYQLFLLIEIADHSVYLDRVLPLFLHLIVYVSNVCTVEAPFPF